MEILKHGKLKRRIFVCKKCGCEFVANGVEYEQTLHYGCFCFCPECGNITIDSKEYDVERSV